MKTIKAFAITSIGDLTYLPPYDSGDYCLFSIFEKKKDAIKYANGSQVLPVSIRIITKKKKR